jgi:alkanesulfonate monooxygenase SsuD/methylene tetrahydromethanopterin reductase-like flavin-dependent oxidoreductase (luciferase family)
MTPPLGFALAATTPADVVVACAHEAEARGYRSFWLNHPGDVDGIANLGPAEAVTSRIDLGVGVVPLHVRGPERIADGVRATGLPPGRLLLGVGSPNPRSLARVREGVAALRELVGSRIVVAALGPRMCRLAGEVGDGVLLNWVTPEHARRSGDLVREGAADAGRAAPTIYTYVRLAVGDDARERLRVEGSRYAASPAYAANFERMGVAPEDTAIAAGAPEQVGDALAAWEGAVDEVVLRALPAGSGVDEALALVRAASP